MGSVINAMNSYVSTGYSELHELKTINLHSHFTSDKLIQLKVHNAIHFKGAVLTQTYYNSECGKVRQDLEFPECYYIEIEGDG